VGLAAEPMDGLPGQIAVKLDDDQRLKVRQRFERENGGYPSGRRSIPR
jgi:hypothetical protein